MNDREHLHVTEQPLVIQRRYSRLAWLGLAGFLPGMWLGGVMAEGWGWSQYNLPGAAVQLGSGAVAAVMCALMIYFASRLTQPATTMN